MKKIFILLTLVAIVISCNNDLEVEMEHRLTAEVNIFNVVKDLKDYDNSALFPDGKIQDNSFRPRVRLFLYDHMGDICYEKTTITNNFSEIVSIDERLKSGQYTLVVTVDVVEIARGNVIFEFFEFKEGSSLNDFRINDLGWYGGDGLMVLGLFKTTFNLEKSQTISIDPEPISSLITFHFTNVQSNNIAYVFYTWDMANDYYSVSDDKSYIETGTFSDRWYSDSQYTGVFEYHYFFPMQNLTLLWGTFDYNGNIINAGSTTFDIGQRVNKMIHIDVVTQNTQIVTMDIPVTKQSVNEDKSFHGATVKMKNSRSGKSE